MSRPSMTPRPEFVPQPEPPLRERGRFKPSRRPRAATKRQKPLEATLTRLQEAALRAPKRSVAHMPAEARQALLNKRQTEQIWKEGFARRRQARRAEERQQQKPSPKN
jgi:hypothetical protein